MDWFQWYLGQPAPIPVASRTTPTTDRLPTQIDVELVDTIYSVVANEQACSVCGHLLGRNLHVRATPIGAPRWPLRVDTSCRGWRRHRHTAQVKRPSRDLMLGALTLRSSGS